MLDLAKFKTCALSMTLSFSGQLMAMYCKDRKIRVFSISNGKLIKIFDETLQMYVDAQATPKLKSELLYLDKVDFEKRLT